MQHGAYRNANRGRQLLLFSGLEYDANVAPMDLDGLIEYHDKKRALIEVKLQHTPVPYGEKTALERMVCDFSKAGKEAVAIIADHKVFDTNKDVYVGDCLVREIYHSKEKRWRPPKKMMTVKMLLDSFILN